MMTEQTAKADARQSAAAAPKPDPDVAERAIREARELTKALPAQKLTASRQSIGTGQVDHHDKDRIVSEFDDPAANIVE